MAQMAIDGEKLRRALFDAGVKPSKASMEIGFAHNYMSVSIARGSISEAGAKGLLMRYGIRPEDYAAEDEEPRAEESPVASAPVERPAAEGGLDCDALRRAVCEGVLDAAVQIFASEDLMNALGKCIYNSVKGAYINAIRMIASGCESGHDEKESVMG